MTYRKERLQQIEETLLTSGKLLGDYEKKLVLSNDPREQMSCKAEIDRLKSDIAQAESEKMVLSADQMQLVKPADASKPTIEHIVLTREGREMVLIPAG